MQSQTKSEMFQVLDKYQQIHFKENKKAAPFFEQKSI